MSQTLQEFLGIRWPERSHKPRAQGLTMVMDTGWPTSFVDSLLDQYGAYLDVVKIWDPHLRAPQEEVRRKIAVYKKHGVRVQPGGIFMEIARIQGVTLSGVKSRVTRGREALGRMLGVAWETDREEDRGRQEPGSLLYINAA